MSSFFILVSVLNCAQYPSTAYVIGSMNFCRKSIIYSALFACSSILVYQVHYYFSLNRQIQFKCENQAFSQVHTHNNTAVNAFVCVFNQAHLVYEQPIEETEKKIKQIV